MLDKTAEPANAVSPQAMRDFLDRSFDMAIESRLNFTAHLVALAIESLGEKQVDFPKPERPSKR